MKKTALFFLTILLFSCNSNVENINEILIAKSNRNTTTHENLNESLKLISYLTGRAILNDVSAKVFIENLSLNSNNNAVNFNTIINGNNDFSSAFNNEFIIYVTGFEAVDGHNRPRPIIRIETDFVTGSMNLDSNPNSDSGNTVGYGFFMSIINQNNIELYFPRPLILENLNNTFFTEPLFITKHPLLDEYPIGLNLWQDRDTGKNLGEFLLFDDALLDATNTNLIVVRPSRSNAFRYENYNVDFERFYNTN